MSNLIDKQSWVEQWGNWAGEAETAGGIRRSNQRDQNPIWGGEDEQGGAHEKDWVDQVAIRLATGPAQRQHTWAYTESFLGPQIRQRNEKIQPSQTGDCQFACRSDRERNGHFRHATGRCGTTAASIRTNGGGRWAGQQRGAQEEAD